MNITRFGAAAKIRATCSRVSGSPSKYHRSSIFRVQPRLDVREQAALDLQAGPEAAHEVEDPLAVPLPILRPRVVPAEAEVVVAPDADRTGLIEEHDGLLQAGMHPAHVAEHHEAVGPLFTQDLDGPPQVV